MADDGQSSVELALVLPLVVLLLLALVQGGLAVRDQILVVHAAREGARAASLDGDAAAAEDAAAAAGPLDRSRLEVRASGRDGPGSLVTVDVSYEVPARVPLVGDLIGDLHLHASASMRVER